MEKLLKNLGERKFRYISGPLSFLGDLAIAIYVYILFADLDRFTQLFHMVAKSQGMDPRSLDAQLIEEQFFITTGSLKLMIGALLFVHLVVYAMHSLKKPTASKYLKFSFIITILTSALFIYEAWSVSPIFSVIFTLLVPTYIFCYQGIRYFNLDQRLPKNKEPKKSRDH
jgi:hypothetical protein